MYHFVPDCQKQFRDIARKCIQSSGTPIEPAVRESLRSFVENNPGLSQEDKRFAGVILWDVSPF